MAFDAGMLMAISHECNNILTENKEGGSKVEKIYMPDKDEIHLMLRNSSGSFRFVISASPNNARMLISQTNKENPQTPPSFCMLLRKKLLGARLVKVSQPFFERLVEIEFDTKDEMGFSSKKYLIAEIMGKHSNIIFCDDNRKIIGAVRTTDATSGLTRRIIPGVLYEYPPSQNKLDPTTTTKNEFMSAISQLENSTLADKAILSLFSGIAPLIAREIVYRATGSVNVSIENLVFDRLWEELEKYVTSLKKHEFFPCLLLKKDTSSTFEYSVYPIMHYDEDVTVSPVNSVSELIDEFFSQRDKNDRIRQRSQDILKLLTNAKNRLERKIEAQTLELNNTSDMEQCRLFGDLITQEMYRIKRGDTTLEALDYSKEPYETVLVELDEKLSPSQNAQRYYKKYNRKKNAEAELERQIEISESELEYIETLFDALSRAETEKDLSELREEMSLWGYMKRDSKKLRLAEKKQAPKPQMYTSPSGYEIYVGKNNLQNDYITTKLSDKNDWWFHVKNYAGSHVLLKLNGREEPPAEDFTFACQLAANNSSAEGDNIAVDYTQIKHIKKPAASKPGFVTYKTYWTAYVTP